MKIYTWILVIAACAFFGLPSGSAGAEDTIKSKALPPIPLSLNEVLAWIDRSHPLLKGAGTEKASARGKMLKALGAFEPILVNDTEIERFIDKGTTKTQSVGFNDTLVEARTPWGFRGSAGIRQAIGDAKIPDLGFGNGQQVILGGFLPLLKGLMINPENAELQRSELADPRAEVKISQTRQDLFLAAASQFWDWVSAAKFVD
ncbi:MAG TPA: TolC family protein, partial [Nitrospira sp.]|nr:TolC family protein [Nitrospira sp.]